MLDTLKEWIARVQNYPVLEAEIKDLQKDASKKTKELANLEESKRESDSKLATTLKEIQDLRKTLNKQRADVSDADFWNNKWKKSIVRYKAPKRLKVIEYVKYRDIPAIDSFADDIIRDYALHPGNVDMVPLGVMRWIHGKSFEYKIDDGEVWKTPEKFFEDVDEGNDCDDFMILMYFLIRKIFQKFEIWDEVKHRLKCVAGNVNKRGVIPSGAGGHAYLNWLRENGQWYTVETTYNIRTAIGNYQKSPQKLNPMYGTIWFTFNEDHSWAQNSITVSKEDFEKFK